ncbi:MAG: bifunctional 4-hydroxy-2-oxoglutarate aldolase/2-dehydro-3-deoxy-phosphogluconate aldolase [Pseudomonadales bacterium]
MRATSLLDAYRLVPVVALDAADQAVPLARALVEGGIACIEVTLRTDAALDAIQAIAEKVPGMTVGAGTIKTVQDIGRAVSAGARFLVSPGTTTELLDEAENWEPPLLPGAATASECMALELRGYTRIKCFPAHSPTGLAFISAMAGPMPALSFCPSGGVNLGNFREYLALPNVFAVSGSFLAPPDLIAAGAFDDITNLARQCTALLSAPDP